MRRFRYESLLYALAFAIALGVRVARLDTPPLSDAEARWALQALGVAQGTRPLLGSQPAYILLTSVLFYLLGAGTNFLARLVPALAGSALVLAPALFAQRLKPRVAVILAFLLAVEPGLVAMSRQAGSGILAVSFALLAWGFWERRRFAWAGILAGLALLSGPLLWEGILGLGLTWLISQAFRDRGADEAPAAPRPARAEWITALWFAVGTVVLGGTLFFLAPNGLSAWTSALPDYLVGWRSPSGVPAGLLLFSLLAYQPLGVILAVVAAVRGSIQGGRRIILLSLWLVVALLLALFYPAHQVSDLAWTLVPLWSLAALELARNLNVFPEERREVLGVVALTVVILAFMWINFTGFLQTQAPSSQATLRIWLLLGSLFLLFISILLVAVGWSIRAARFGAIWGLTAALGIYAISAMTAAAGLRVVPESVELWRPGGRLPEAGLLRQTVDDLSDWSRSNADAQPVTIVALDSPALQWLLRGHELHQVAALDVSSQPPILIAVGQNNPQLAAGYRGQEFVWRQDPMWDQTTVFDWFRWLGFHQVVQEPQKVILWVRTDLFIDSPVPKP
ncbi:MAG: hypothetical protein ACM3MF_03980 [Anaerolineae bacterium]